MPKHGTTPASYRHFNNRPGKKKDRSDHQRPLNTKHHYLYYLTASICGATVMMIELLGTRIIGPYYGVSMIVWSSLLSTALLALSIGYTLGGRLADTQPRLRLSHLLLLTSLLIGLIPLISKPVQLWAGNLGLRWGALTSALLLFTPCLITLGMVGPYVIKVTTRGLEHVGRTAGSVYAISTLGSVLGTLVLGFYLLPVLGTMTILLSLSGLLLVLSLILTLYERWRLKATKTLPKWEAATASLALLILVGAANMDSDYPNAEVVFEQETHYGWVRVIDQPTRGIRWLMSGGSTIGAEDLASGKGLLGYQQLVGKLPLFKPEGKTALLVGLGSGHLVNTYNRFDIVTDSIEIDPAVAEAAERFFSFEGSGEVMIGDARYQVRNLDKQYDFIVHDSFTGGAEPIHLLSQEMFQTLKARLKPGGLLALNLVGLTPKDERGPVEAVANTLDSVFAHRRSFVADPDADFNDFVFLVSDQPIQIAPEVAQSTGADWLLSREMNIESTDGLVITDDYNPMETLNIAKAEHYRNILIDRVGEELLFY